MQIRINRNVPKVYVLGLVLALVLSACAGDTTEAPTQAPPTAAPTQAAPTQAPPTQAPPTAAPTQAAPTQASPPSGPTPDTNLPVAVFPTAVPGEPSAIANQNTTIYGGPGVNYVVYAAFLGGETAQVVGKSEDSLWWAISVPVAPNASGWVDAGWVTVNNVDNVPVLLTPPVPPTTELVPPGPDDPQVLAIANLYVHSGPAVNYPAYGIAPAGATGRVIGVSEDSLWWVVRLNTENVGAGYGWVDAQYTQASNVAEVQTIQNPEPNTDIPAQAPPPSGVPTATATDYVNVRTGPGTHYTVLGVASPGASAEVSGKSADGAWWQVKIPTEYSTSGLGWVSASYVVTQDTDSVPVVDAPAAPPPLETTPPPTGSANCTMVAQDPIDGTVFSAGTNFTTSWVLKNTGSDAWDAGEYDIAFAGAVANMLLHQGSDRYDLANAVGPGGTYNFSVPMIAPFEPGVYGEMWQIILGDQSVCPFYVYIEVR